MYLDFKRPSFGFVVLDSVLTSAMDRNDDNGAPRAKIRRLSSMFDIETTELPLPYPCNNLCIAFVIKNIEHYKSALLSKFFILQEVMFYEVAEALKNGVFLFEDFLLQEAFEQCAPFSTYQGFGQVQLPLLGLFGSFCLFQLGGAH
jgi:hypothetical protein